jgi:predicted MPP superfamily phosphohydrolase
VLQRILAPLNGRNALAVLGDRDVRTDSLKAQISGTLQAAGIRVLSNNSVPIVIRQDTAWVAGTDPELIAEAAAEQEWILLNASPPGRTALLLTHNAGVAPRAPAGRFPVILAGNTFCGDIEVPGSPRLSWLREQVLPGGTVEGIDNLFIVDRNVVMVTCGLGYGFVPLRFGAAPEVPIVTLIQRGAAVESPAAGSAASGAVADSLIQQYGGTGDTTGTAPPQN